MEQRLYEAAWEGDVISLHEVLEEDRLVLDRTIVNGLKETPLHVATIRGHVDFVKEILNINSELAGEFDSQGLSPLHIASAKGYTEIAKLLLLSNPVMCEASDRDGRNPIHIAAIKGRVSVLKELVRARVGPARAVVVDMGETILHLCVRNNKLEALKFLVETMDHDHEFLNHKDDYGNTILHLAVADKQTETIKYLVANAKVDVKATNANGFTALDILSQSRRNKNDLVIGDILREAGALRANNVARRPNIPHFVVPNTHLSNPKTNLTQGEWLSKKRDALMVVASLIATMAFQSGLNPPGGVWQEDKDLHYAGESIMAYQYPQYYLYYLRTNTIGFVASLSTILLLISGLPFKRRLFMWILMVIMWLTVNSMALTYAISIVVLHLKRIVNHLPMLLNLQSRRGVV